MNPYKIKNFQDTMAQSTYSHSKGEEWNSKEGSVQSKTKTQKANIKSCNPCLASRVHGGVMWVVEGMGSPTPMACHL
jgi:hypothetical protein